MIHLGSTMFVRIVLRFVELMITPMNQTTSIRVVQVQGKVEFYPKYM